jgi:restriction system protein
LRGVLRPGHEIGLFVSTGGFTREARREAETGAGQVTLLDLDGFIDLWVRHQDTLSESARARLRLVPVHFWCPDSEVRPDTRHLLSELRNLQGHQQHIDPVPL